MSQSDSLLIFGASARAAAFSALRSSFKPWCADLFADADLQARAPAFALAPESYPADFVRLAQLAPPGPWMYVGGLENRPGLVRRLAHLRPLWGNGATILSVVRSPSKVQALLAAADVPCPDVRSSPPALAESKRWLLKPHASAGGAGIRSWGAETKGLAPSRRMYWQEFIEGESCAAVYVGDGRHASLLGVIIQLVGAEWLHAGPFRYCGSVGPMRLEPGLREAFQRLGDVLVAGSGMRGLFGVDCIRREGVPWPVEVNPRYTASIEVLEYAEGLSALTMHRSAFEIDVARARAERSRLNETVASEVASIVGKAILYARAPLTFPGDGPWLTTLLSNAPVSALPAFADIPHAGQRIAAGQPMLTFFARADSFADCLQHLRQTALALDHWLFDR